jgi:glutamate--cysteine ligase
MPGVSTEGYFALIRNFRRHSFLLLYLFGASPAVCSSFVQGREHRLQSLRDGTLYLPHATSLRMGRLGYQSDAQAALSVSYNCLNSYAASLHEALTRSYPPYEALGIVSPGGEYVQLATSLLQIENEFYGTIRPKRIIRPGERPLHALRERGVEYVEVRCMDLDPFEPIGIGAATIRFLDVFLLHCLLSDSPPDTPQEIAALARNQHRTAERGRESQLSLERAGQSLTIEQWGTQLLQEFLPIAEALDALHGVQEHCEAVEWARDMLHSPDRLPSARVLHAMNTEYDGSHTAFIGARTQQIRQALMAQPLPIEIQAQFEHQALESLQEQQRLEDSETMSFEAFRQGYLSAQKLVVGEG